MSMQEIQAMPELPGFVTHICIETGGILVTESKLLKIKIKQLYYREPLLVILFIALQTCSETCPNISVVYSHCSVYGSSPYKIAQSNTKYFYSRQTLFVLLTYSTKQNSQLVKKFPTFYEARKPITARQPLFSRARNFVKMLRNNIKPSYSRQLSFDSLLVIL